MARAGARVAKKVAKKAVKTAVKVVVSPRALLRLKAKRLQAKAVPGQGIKRRFKMEFKVGDIVKPKEDHRNVYASTGHPKWEGRVIEIGNDGYFTCETTKHPEVGAGGRNTIQMRLYTLADPELLAKRREEARAERLKAEEEGRHIHDWKEKWEGTYRECDCGRRQWKLACWTNSRWENLAPDQLFQPGARPDVLKGVVNGGLNAMFAKYGHLLRQWDIIPTEILEERINIIGAGAIGSFVALGLVKMGFRDIVVYDSDNVNEENISTQLYGKVYVDTPNQKVKALDALVSNYIGDARRAGGKFTVHAQKFAGQHKLKGIFISAVDSMEARAMLWNFAKTQGVADWFIDARMGAETALMYTINPKDKKDITAFEKTLYSDEDAVKEKCTAQATVYTALLISGMVCKAVKDVLTDNPKYPRVMIWNIRDNEQKIWNKPLADFTPKPKKKKMKKQEVLSAADLKDAEPEEDRAEVVF